MPTAVYKALIVGLSLLVLLLAYQTPLLSNKSLFSTGVSRNMAAAQKSRSVMMFAGMLKYRMSPDVYSYLARLDVEIAL